MVSAVYEAPFLGLLCMGTYHTEFWGGQLLRAGLFGLLRLLLEVITWVQASRVIRDYGILGYF